MEEYQMKRNRHGFVHFFKKQSVFVWLLLVSNDSFMHAMKSVNSDGLLRIKSVPTGKLKLVGSTLSVNTGPSWVNASTRVDGTLFCLYNDQELNSLLLVPRSEQETVLIQSELREREQRELARVRSDKKEKTKRSGVERMRLWDVIVLRLELQH